MTTKEIYFKLIIVITLIFSLYSCEKDTLETSSGETNFNRYSFATTHFKNLPKETKEKFLYNREESKESYTFLNYGFEIDLELGNLITDNETSLRSYTFNILNRNEYETVQNILITELEQNVFTVGLIEYKFNYIDLLDKDNLALDYNFSYKTLDENQIILNRNQSCSISTLSCMQVFIVTTTSTTNYPPCNTPGEAHANGVICAPTTTTETNQVLIGTDCSWNSVPCLDDNSSSGGYWTPGDTTTTGGQTSDTNGSNVDFNNPIVTAPISLNPLKVRIKNFLVNLPDNLKIFYFELSTEDKISLQNFLDSTVETQVNNNLSYSQQATAIGNQILDLMFQNPSLSFDEAFENIYINNVDLFEDFYFYLKPDDPILDMDAFLECIDPNQPATLTIYIDQPINGSVKPIAFDGIKPNVGHVFVSLTQNNNTVVYGFYPEEKVKSFTFANGAIGNNQGDHYDVSISTTVSPIQLPQIINFSLIIPSSYNINKFNCTDYAMHIAQIGGLTLPSAFTPAIPGGGGSAPSVLGENIRNLPDTQANPINRTISNAQAEQRNCN